MVTLNINIEGDGKSTSSPSLTATNSQTQQDFPRPTSFDRIESVGTDLPSPDSSEKSLDSGQSLEFVPNPEASGFSFSAAAEQSPSPMMDSVDQAATEEAPSPAMDSADQSATESGVPEPKDLGKSGTATPAAKRKTRATTTKTSGK